MKRLVQKILPEIAVRIYQKSKHSKRQKDLNLSHADRVKKWGHRLYVGGNDPEFWYGLGKRQYHFLVTNGLRSHHRFLDIACGSLRLGQYLIPMLDEGNYYGLEGEPSLIDAGLKNEMLFGVAAYKKAQFSSNYEFDLSFCERFDYAIAQSLFTHLTLNDIGKCFKALAEKAHKDSKFYFTFGEGNESKNRHRISHANKKWQYRFETLEKVAQTYGFDCVYLGDWGHERKQVIAVATLNPTRLT